MVSGLLDDTVPIYASCGIRRKQSSKAKIWAGVWISQMIRPRVAKKPRRKGLEEALSENKWK